ncbi:hypothetical protein C8R43DRAFT_956368 [Mycena crocata]|nr:hypothetical protein C8R43DRAFT_956368 [Mycena crocata]
MFAPPLPSTNRDSPPLAWIQCRQCAFIPPHRFTRGPGRAWEACDVPTLSPDEVEKVLISDSKEQKKHWRTGVVQDLKQIGNKQRKLNRAADGKMGKTASTETPKRRRNSQRESRDSKGIHEAQLQSTPNTVTGRETEVGVYSGTEVVNRRDTKRVETTAPEKATDGTKRVEQESRLEIFDKKRHGIGGKSARRWGFGTRRMVRGTVWKRRSRGDRN